jgi:hypothetical protein
VVESEPIKMNVDFKDIDFLYYLYGRYGGSLTKALEIMGNPKAE